jgi:hypothetical protein
MRTNLGLSAPSDGHTRKYASPLLPDEAWQASHPRIPSRVARPGDFFLRPAHSGAWRASPGAPAARPDGTPLMPSPVWLGVMGHPHYGHRVLVIMQSDSYKRAGGASPGGDSRDWHSRPPFSLVTGHSYRRRQSHPSSPLVLSRTAQTYTSASTVPAPHHSSHHTGRETPGNGR